MRFTHKFCRECGEIQLHFDGECVVCKTPTPEEEEKYVPVRTGRRGRCGRPTFDHDDQPDRHELQLPTGDR